MNSPWVFTHIDSRAQRMLQYAGICLLIVFGTAPEAFGQSEKPRAQILWLQGEVALVDVSRHEEDASRQPLEVFDLLREGMEIVVEADSLLHYLLDERLLLEVSRPGRYIFSANGLISSADPQSEVSQDRQLLVAGNWCVGKNVQGKHLAWSSDPVVQRGAQQSETLLLKQPVETLVKGKKPSFHWDVGQDGKRVDLQLWRLGDEGSLRLLEEWKNLGGEEQRPFRDLSEAHFHAIRLRESVTMVLQSKEPSNENVVPDRHEVLVWFKVYPARRQGLLEEAIDALASLVVRQPWAGPGLMVLKGKCLEREGLLAKAQTHWSELSDLHGSRKGILEHVRRLDSRRLLEPRRKLKPILPFGIIVPDTEKPLEGTEKSKTSVQDQKQPD